MHYRVIKENDLFLMSALDGDLPAERTDGYGLYAKDTRFLSRMELRINGEKPILLSSSADQNYIAHIRLTNPHMERDGQLLLWRESIELRRTRFIYEGALYETIRATSYAPQPVQFELSVQLDADFADMFIVRGFSHGNLGARFEEGHATNTQARERRLRYRGADGVTRETLLRWSKEATHADPDGTLAFRMQLAHLQADEIAFFIAPVMDGAEPMQHEPSLALDALQSSYKKWKEEAPAVKSDVPLFDRLYQRGLQDLRVLTTDLGYGPFPVAGLPWYAVPFGRDSLIAALQLLPVHPEVAKGTLFTMAAYQGKQEDAWRDEQPGKIMHELRSGELAGTNQVPFTPYYGTVDATPLFLMLAAAYHQWTGDLSTIRALLPALEAALKWLEDYGDADQDGFVEYCQQSGKGIANQGWKDSSDSIVHRNGEYAEAPIALVEVQGYYYQALTALAPLFAEMGLQAQAEQMLEHAAALKASFEQCFWMEDEQYYAIALDKDKKQVKSVTSNPGHILMSGIASHERAQRIADRLVAADLFSGYGIRTMSENAAGYNPMSYHDGSVWPHDNAMSLLGLARTGHSQQAVTVIDGLLRAAAHFEYDRLPELFCGYSAAAEAPVPYPVACSPQAWAAGTPLVFVQTLLGIVPDALGKRIRLQPALLPGMNRLRVEGISIGQGKLSVQLTKTGECCAVEVLHNSSGWQVHLVGLAELAPASQELSGRSL